MKKKFYALLLLMIIGVFACSPAFALESEFPDKLPSSWSCGHQYKSIVVIGGSYYLYTFEKPVGYFNNDSGRTKFRPQNPDISVPTRVYIRVLKTDDSGDTVGQYYKWKLYDSYNLNKTNADNYPDFKSNIYQNYDIYRINHKYNTVSGDYISQNFQDPGLITLVPGVLSMSLKMNLTSQVALAVVVIAVPVFLTFQAFRKSWGHLATQLKGL